MARQAKPLPESAYSHTLAICEWSDVTKSWLVIDYKENSQTAWMHFIEDIQKRNRKGYLLNFGQILASNNV
jgi:hypothetical protein